MSANGALAHYLVPNLFDPESYFQLDVRYGVMRNRFGTKSCVFSGHLLKGLYTGLKHECGPAWRLVLRRCGETWGERFAKRFLDEVGSFYGQGPDAMAMGRFTALLEEYFAIAGWGKLRMDYSLAGGGIIQAEVENAILGDLLGDAKERMDVLIEGVLKAVFSRISGQKLDCLETQCIATGAPHCAFVIGLESRLEKVPEMLEAGATHAQVIARLTS